MVLHVRFLHGWFFTGGSSLMVLHAWFFTTGSGSESRSTWRTRTVRAEPFVQNLTRRTYCEEPIVKNPQNLRRTLNTSLWTPTAMDVLSYSVPARAVFGTRRSVLGDH